MEGLTDYIYDIETFPNAFLMAVEEVGFTANRWMFEISDWHDDSMGLTHFMWMLQETKARMVGFNNMGFDYPVIHHFQNHLPSMDNVAHQLWQKASAIINDDDGGHM